MTFHPFERAAADPSRSLGFIGNRMDRQAEGRTETALQEAMADPRLRVIVVGKGRVCLAMDGAAPACYFGAEGLAELAAMHEEAVLLGHDEDGPVVAMPGRFDPDLLPARLKAIDLRSVNSQGILDPAASGAVAQGAALLAWHASCRYCGRCGGATRAEIGGYRRVCSSCGTQHFPRTDPVVIMLTVTTGRCLLGRSPHFPPGMYSTLAGFVEPGETIENAVRRETLEESGVAVGRVAYHASQPWPFPHSLMIGCFGEALSEELAPDYDEIEDCRWFGRDEVRAMLAGSHPDGLMVPPPAAIANCLIRAWADDGAEF